MASAKKSKPKTYATAGVDIAAGDALVDELKRKNSFIGGFSGLAELPSDVRNPRLLMATDGVGTKLLVAQLAGLHKTIGIDLVAMCVNDLIVSGGRPLYFLDYFATGKLDRHVARDVIGGIMKGCEQAGCDLVGGETAEMPGMYGPGHYDLAGFSVGVVDAKKVVDGRGVKAGDAVIGLASSGLHSNGYSLARAALLPKSDAAARKKLATIFRGRSTLAKELLKPTIIYVPTILELLKEFDVRAMANITGGGIAGNMVRSLPKGISAHVDRNAWKRPPIFEAIAEQGPVEEDEMFHTFNMGIGYSLIVPQKQADAVLARCKELKQKAWVIGETSRCKGAAKVECI